MMQRNEKWKGLVSKASPYLLEAGSTQEQVNLHNRNPGQLEVREGMRAVGFTENPTTAVLDLFSYRTTDQHMVISLNTSGELQALVSPTIQKSTEIGLEPPCEISDGQTTTNYLWQYKANDSDGVQKDLIYIWNGGIPAQDSWQYKVSAGTIDGTGAIGPSADAGGAEPETLEGIEPDSMTPYE